MTALYFCRLQDAYRTAGSECAHRLLEAAAAAHWPALPHPLPLAREKNGKPFLPGFPQYQFNLSHSGAWAVCFLSETPVGVDLQRHGAVPPHVSKRFTAEERAMAAAHPPEFFDLWVKKEAYLKADGSGLTRRLDSFSVLPLAQNQVGKWTIRLVEPPEAGYSCAVCQLTANGTNPLVYILSGI